MYAFTAKQLRYLLTVTIETYASNIGEESQTICGKYKTIDEVIEALNGNQREVYLGDLKDVVTIL